MKRIRTVVVISLAALTAAVLLAGGPLHAQEGGDVENGAALYAVNCAVCHGTRGEGRVGATLDKVFATIAPDEFLTEVIERGRAGTFMPAWSTAYGGPLIEAQVADIVAYIESWGTTVEPPEPAPPRPEVEIPPVPEVDGDPNAGYTVFQTNCAACHGDQGQGRIGATLNTAFAAIEPGAFVVETVRRGVEGSLMPPFALENGGPLSDDDINNVAAYVLSIQRQGGPGTGGEIVGSGSAWPLIIVGAVLVLVIVGLGIAVARRERAGT